MIKSMIDKQPIGAAVRGADEAFARLVRRTSGNGNFNRIDWQFLKLLNEKSKVSKAEAYAALRSLLEKPSIELAIKRFREGGLIFTKGDEIAVTEKGKTIFTEVARIQEEIKERSLVGITEAAYNITIDTLRKMVSNLKEYMPDEHEQKLPTDPGGD